MAKFRADKGTRDSDRDGLSDDFERNVLGTDPFTSDTDGDGMSDLREKDFATSPVDRDTDHDGLSDLREVQIGTNPHRADSDSDGISDLQEVRAGTASAPDEDGDGVPDWVDAAESDWDTDRDGLTDAEEHWLRTDPLRPYSDPDTIDDGTEVDAGTNPRDPGGPWDGRPILQVPNGPDGPVTPPVITVPKGPNTDDATRLPDIPNGTLVDNGSDGGNDDDGTALAMAGRGDDLSADAFTADDGGSDDSGDAYDDADPFDPAESLAANDAYGGDTYDGADTYDDGADAFGGDSELLA
jgi:hypothetical protein